MRPCHGNLNYQTPIATHCNVCLRWCCIIPLHNHTSVQWHNQRHQYYTLLNIKMNTTYIIIKTTNHLAGMILWHPGRTFSMRRLNWYAQSTAKQKTARIHRNVFDISLNKSETARMQHHMLTHPLQSDIARLNNHIKSHIMPSRFATYAPCTTCGYLFSRLTPHNHVTI